LAGDGQQSTYATVSPHPSHPAGFPDKDLEAKVSKVAFEDFFRAKRSELIWFLLSQKIPLHEAEDAAQSAFVEAWQKWDTIENPWGWVRTVAAQVLAIFAQGDHHVRSRGSR
jgi:RNA polymerase sigma-70 factor (ECF subfamily)